MTGTGYTTIGSGTFTAAANTWFEVELQELSTGQQKGYISTSSSVIPNYGTASSLSTSDGKWSSFNSIALLPQDPTSTLYARALVRSYPPAGIMPTVSYGAVQSASGPVGPTVIITIASNPVAYGSTDVLSATGNAVNTITLGYCVGSGVCGSPISLASGTGSATNTICDTISTMANCWGVGTYNVVAKDVGASAINTIVLTITKAPILTALSTSIQYGISNTITSFTTPSFVSLSLIRNGIPIYTSGANTLSNTICSPTCWAAGSYIVNVIALNNNNFTTSSNSLTITVAPQIMTWTSQCTNPYLQWGSVPNPCITTATVNTVSNQMIASLYFNGNLNGTTSNSISSFLPTNMIGTDTWIFTAPSSANYTANSITYSTMIYVPLHVGNSTYTYLITPPSNTLSFYYPWISTPQAQAMP